MVRKQSRMEVSTNGKVYWRDASGHYAKGYNPLDNRFVAKKIKKAGNLYGSAAFGALSIMSQDFLDSYLMPEDTGNLKESTSVSLILMQGKDDSQRDTKYISGIHVVEPQHWGNWGGIKEGAGRGEDFLWNARDVLASGRPLDEDMTVVLRVGIPYSVPLNEVGAHGHHIGYFDNMAAAFKKSVLQISERVASKLNQDAVDYDNPELILGTKV